MKEKQNQHFIPQYYFKKFSGDKCSIRMLLKNSGKVIKNVTIDNQASKNNFYGDCAIEDKVTQFDNKYSSVIHHAIIEIENRSLTIDSVTGLMEALCFQYLRTLVHREEQNPLMSSLEDYFQPQIDDFDNYESGVSEEATQAVRKAMKYILEGMSNGQRRQLYQMFNITEELNEIDDLDAVFLSNSTSSPFIFGDSPVTRANISLQHLNCSQRGNMHHGLIIYYPISSNLAFLMYDKSAYQLLSGDLKIVTISENKDIDNLNRLQMHHAANSIYFEDILHKEYVEMLWRDEKESFSDVSSKMESGEEVTLDGYLTGRVITALVESELNLQLDLSFLNTNNLSNFPCSPIRERFVSQEEVPNLYHGHIDIDIDQRGT